MNMNVHFAIPYVLGSQRLILRYFMIFFLLTLCSMGNVREKTFYFGDIYLLKKCVKAALPSITLASIQILCNLFQAHSFRPLNRLCKIGQCKMLQRELRKYHHDYRTSFDGVSCDSLS